MRILLCVGWLTLPVLGYAWHCGPGQDCLRGDNANHHLLQARKAVAAGQHAEAIQHFSAALRELPEGKTALARQIRVEKAKSMMQAHQLADANSELEAIVSELESDTTATPALLADARSALANSQYYTTWAMRLRGYARDAWEPEIEAARQNYRWLAENARERGDAQAATKWSQDCESAIRLARLDLNELQGLPLPSQ